MPLSGSPRWRSWSSQLDTFDLAAALTSNPCKLGTTDLDQSSRDFRSAAATVWEAIELLLRLLNIRIRFEGTRRPRSCGRARPSGHTYVKALSSASGVFL